MRSQHLTSSCAAGLTVGQTARRVSDVAIAPCGRSNWAARTAAVLLLGVLSGCAMPGGTPRPATPDQAPREPSTVAREPTAATRERATTTKAATGIPPAADAVLAPPDVQAAYGRAVLLLETGDQNGAESEFKRFVALNPGYSGPHVNLAIIYQAQGRLEEAQEALDTALALNPSSAAALNQQGILHRRNGQFADAESAYLKAVTVNPEYPLAHLNLGILNELYLGRLADALVSYQNYQALTVEEDETVARWITDLTRRTARN